jgi:RNA polymerase sigma-70 factor (ECF subfamily)
VQLVETAEAMLGGCREATDAELVARFQHGDVAAFETLYRRHQPVLLRHLGRIVGDGVAEELAQEAFLRAARRLPRDVGGRFRSWLLRVGHNLAVDYLRGVHRERTLEARMLRQREQAGDVEALHLEAVDDLRSVIQVLRKLPPRYQEVLVHREVYGFDYGTIARLMDTTTGALQTLLHRARGRFRDEYRREYGAVA